METPTDILTSRVYVNPGVSICNLVSYGETLGLMLRDNGETIPHSRAHRE